jgi:hypothetical protein
MANERPQPQAAFEPRDVPPLLPLWLGAGLSGCVLLVMLCISLLYPLAERQQQRGPLQKLPPAPRLLVSPQADRAQYDRLKARELETAPVPIDRAMLATAQQGWGPPK